MALRFTLAFAGLALAFPTLTDRKIQAVRRQSILNDPLGISKAETNCGPTPCGVFDADDQYVSTDGENIWLAPAESDIRGPCPGLNAAANHGYLPRTGIATIEETAGGLSAAYGLDPILGAALAAYAVALDGNVLEGVWSIGGPLPSDPLASAAGLGDGQGLSYSHNNYEGDASIGRNDAYINNGDAHSLDIEKFEQVYSVGGSEDRYTLDKFRQRFESVQQASIATNPYYFTGFFSTVVVVPAAYNFVINLMSNHSAEEPNGYLDGSTFKSFFGVTGEPGSFVWQKGQERIPDNWYRRPSAVQYTAQDTVGDVLLTYLTYPNTFLLGGNTGKVNSFLGVDLSNLTNNKYALENLGQGDNFACFATELLQNGAPNFINPLINDVAAATNLINTKWAPIISQFNCTQIGQYDFTLFEQFPGRSYSPTGPDTNY